MLKIAITLPEDVPNEGQRIAELLCTGFDYVHIRKPNASSEQIARLIESIPIQHHPRLKLHDGFDLLDRYRLGGVHLNSRNHIAPSYECLLSISCHTIKQMDIELSKGIYQYVTLSPIFDSISKPAYHSPFDVDKIKNHIAGKSVIALGGITYERLTEIERAGFMGAAMVGAVWL